MTLGVHREEQRLRRIFERALWLAAAVAGQGALGCSAPAAPETAGDEGPAEAVEPASAEAASASQSSQSCAPLGFTPNPPDACGNYVRLPCGLPAGVTPGSRCYLWLNDCQKICPGVYFNCRAVDASCVDGGVVKDSAGGIDIDCSVCAKGIGRLPAGLARGHGPRASSALGGYFAVAAHLEAASVHAFRRLGAELAAHGAPAEILRAARRAQRDEVRHARLTGRMARRFGGAPARARVARLPTRPLDVVAIENAVEGCVRETFGALVASYQAASARDPEIARLMESIARDETRHAALSWAVARWAAPRLDAEARARLDARCREAIATLKIEAEAGVPCELMAGAGLPGAEQQRALVGALEEQLWGSDPIEGGDRS